MTDRIVVEGIRGLGYHGVFEHERRDGQQFLVDVAIELDLRRPGRSDNLVDTVHYGEVAAQVLARIEGEPFDLIEALAEVIAADVLSLPGVEAVDVVVHKPQAPVGVPVTDVRVEIRRERGTRVVIALGSNVGDRVATLTEAVEALAEVPRLALIAVSDLVESDPFGGPDQPAYLNGVVLANFAGSPATLLRALHAIEHRNGRTPLIKRNGTFEPATWADAYAEIARRLPPLIAAHGRNATAVAVGNPSAHKIGLISYFGKLARALGTKNAFSASTLK